MDGRLLREGDGPQSSPAASLRQAVMMIGNMRDPQTVIPGGVLPRPVLEALVARIEPLPRSVSLNKADGSGTCAPD